ncbi:MAG: zinc ABC transporter substrate-binding protein [Rhodospirillaceae bacterium]|nr:zinc ABC transporter substrate-binding protein [Rhodospirillaceae bacterium]
MKYLLLLAAFFSLATLHAPQARAVEVVVSIKPVHSLVAAVMGKTGKPRLLLGGDVSPHTYPLRPSEARALTGADLVVWIGRNFEKFLDRPIAGLGSGARVQTLRDAAGMRLLPARGGGIWEAGRSRVHVDETEEPGHDHSGFDMHIWLDPANGSRIVEVVAESLVRIDPGRADTYRKNAAATRKRIAALEESLRGRLEPVRRRAFIVFHDAFQYFEFAFGLNSKGTIAVDPAQPPGARRLAELRAALADYNIGCVFSEPQFEPDLVRTVVEGTRIRTGTLDPLGFGVEPGPGAWFAIMRGLGNAVAECLGRP